MPPIVPAPGDNGPAYLDWGAAPECLWAEVTTYTTAGSSQIPSWRMSEASQQTFPGWQQHPAPPLPPPPHSGPWPGTELACLRSHPGMQCLWVGSEGRYCSHVPETGPASFTASRQPKLLSPKAHTSLRGPCSSMRTSPLDFSLGRLTSVQPSPGLDPPSPTTTRTYTKMKGALENRTHTTLRISPDHSFMGPGHP